MIDDVAVHELDLQLRRTFTTSHGSTDMLDVQLLRLEAEGSVGWGEGHAMPAVTGETPDELERDLATIEADAIDPDDLEGTLERHGDLGPGARAAVDLALHDLAGRRSGRAVHRMLGFSDGALPSAATVTLTDPEDAARQAREWTKSGYTRLKVKVGEDGTVLDLVDAVREVLPEVRPPMPDPEIWIDANEALGLDASRELLPELAERDVALLEQPLPREEREELAELAADSPIDIVVDEPIQAPSDVDAFAGVEGPLAVNVKVQKVGGLRPARACIERAREADLDVMVGCTIETGLGIASGASLCGAVDRADLDGNLFLEQDPFPLPRPMPGHAGTRSGPGLGVHPDPRFEGLGAASRGTQR